jgi:hypothetical protein
MMVSAPAAGDDLPTLDSSVDVSSASNGSTPTYFGGVDRSAPTAQERATREALWFDEQKP